MSFVHRAASALALTAATLGAVAPLAARAEAPQQLTQVPGYYRQTLGQFEITSLYDGQITLPGKLFQNASPQEKQALLARMFRADPTPTSVIGFLINTGSQLILVDTGAAKLFGPTLGNILSNLKASGYEPAQVDTVLLTHLHPDHVGGLIAPDGQLAFPNAVVHAPQADVDHWLSPEVAAKAPDGVKPLFKMAQDVMAPYVAAGKLKTFTGEGELLPGVKPVAEHGHTPGHTGYLITSKGQQLLLWGDVVHNAALQFPKPSVTVEFDFNQAMALATRKKLFNWTAKEGLLVAGAHLPFPGVGRVRKDGQDRFSWVPVDFMPVVPPAR
jgi:glyoxylase-like metal-dependent hydrolase (beta-lactamase superfamily II)